MPKCPKCQYLSFDSGDRCRNCGYDFSLAADSTEFDLALDKENDPIGPLGDFSLNETPAAAAQVPLFRKDAGDPDAPLVTPNATPRAPLSVRRGPPTTGRPVRPKRERQEPDQAP